MSDLRAIVAAGLVGVVGGVAFGDAEPALQDGALVFDQDAAIGKGLSDSERAWLKSNPLTAKIDGRSLQTVPTADLYCPPEYAAAEGIVFSYRGPSGWLQIVREMVVEVTTTGDAKAWVAVSSSGVENSARTLLQNAGADMSRVEFVRTFTDTIWMRDYGPRFVFEGGVRVIVDHTYNRPRPNDNNFPTVFGNDEDHHRYLLPLIHGGGNYHLFGTEVGYATDLIQDENPTKSPQEIIDLWREYQGIETELTDALPAFIDATQHIDMWMIPVSDDTVIVSDWPLAGDSGSIQDQICDAFAAQMIAEGKNVLRTPARTRFGTHYTYTNAVICNDLVLVPTFSGVGAAGFNSDALAVWQAAAPDKTIVQIECQALVTAAGVMHCIVKHVPAAANGSDPVAYLQTQRDGDVLLGGSNVSTSWISDDAEGVVGSRVEFSLDGGASWNEIGAGLDGDDDLTWSVPNVSTVSALLRVRSTDTDGNTAIAQSPKLMTIAAVNPSCPADVTGPVAEGLGDSKVDIEDLLYVLREFGATGSVVYTRGDITGDGGTDIEDLLAVLREFGTACR